nr:uncharacterized protein LOC109193912 isoform X1 [Ipomoea batatas]
MVEATKVEIQATAMSDDGEGPRLTLHGPHIAGKDDGELMGTDEEEYVSSSNNSGDDLMIPVVDESPLQLGRRLLGAAVESNSSAAPGY